MLSFSTLSRRRIPEYCRRSSQIPEVHWTTHRTYLYGSTEWLQNKRHTDGPVCWRNWHRKERVDWRAKPIESRKCATGWWPCSIR